MIYFYETIIRQLSYDAFAAYSDGRNRIGHGFRRCVPHGSDHGRLRVHIPVIGRMDRLGGRIFPSV